MNRRVILAWIAFVALAIGLGVAPLVAMSAVDEPGMSTAPMVAKEISGTVMSVNTHTDIVTLTQIKGAPSGQMNFVVTGSTNIIDGGRRIGLEDLKSGKQVTVSYQFENGQNLAQSIFTLMPIPGR